MKENKKPILSICIPTWNRRYSLQYTLKSIMDQEEFRSWDVEIVISDNASTDETETEVWKLCKKYINIKYFRNKENIWWNPNINKAFSLWTWEYLWLLWSDSIIINDWIRDTINTIKNTKPDIIYYNREDWQPLYIDDKLPEFDTSRNIYQVKWQKSFVRLLNNLYWFNKSNFWFIEKIITFISIRCISKKQYDKIIKTVYSQQKDFDKHSFSQTILFFFKEVENSIIVLCTPHISRNRMGKQNRTSYWVTWKIMKDLIYIYKYIQNKYWVKFKKAILCKSIFLWSKRYFFSVIWKIISFLWLLDFIEPIYRKRKNK